MKTKINITLFSIVTVINVSALLASLLYIVLSKEYVYLFFPVVLVIILGAMYGPLIFLNRKLSFERKMLWLFMIILFAPVSVFVYWHFYVKGAKQFDKID